MSARRLRAVFHKELLHILRDPRSLVMAVAIPLLLLLLFGYALTLDVDRVPVLVYNQDGSPESLALVARFDGSRYFTVVGHAASYAEIDDAVNRDRVLLALVIGNDFARTLARGDVAPVQLLIDGSDSNTASLALGYAESVVSLYSLELRGEAMNKRGMRDMRPPVETRTRTIYNPEMQSRNFIVPGITAVILMIIAALLTSLTIAREWESGTMEQLLSTPVRAEELLLGKLLAFFLVGLLDMAIAVGVGV
jgi:ABC-2 type transport system permease protein